MTPPSETGARSLLTFGVFADAHYAPITYADRYCADSIEKLKVCIDAFNARDLSLAVNLGDSVDACGSVDEGLAYLAEFGETFARFRGERRLVLGNHDLETFTKQQFVENCGVDGAKAYGSFDHGGVHFAVLDGNCHEDGTDFAAGDYDWADSWVADEQVAWLADDLAGAAGWPVVVLCHECLDQPEGKPADPHVVRNHDAVRSVIERAGNVAVVIQGHCHPGRHRVLNGIPYITLAAMCVGPGLGNNAFAIMSIGEGAIEVEGFGRQESFRLRCGGKEEESADEKARPATRTAGKKAGMEK